MNTSLKLLSPFLVTGLLTSIIIVGCSKTEPVVSFPIAACRYEWTVSHREIQRQGACLVYTKIDKTQVCAMYSHYKVQQQAQELLCQRTEWRDVE